MILCGFKAAGLKSVADLKTKPYLRKAVLLVYRWGGTFCIALAYTGRRKGPEVSWKMMHQLSTSRLVLLMGQILC